MATARAHLIIHGRVQGVWYRAETRSAAMRIGGLTGWVRNRSDGTVEALVEGERGDVEALIQWCRQGPPMARVTDIDIDWEEPAGDLEAFDARF